MITDNPYNRSTDLLKHDAWQEGWCAGYDDNEEEWVKRTLPIVGELEESIRYDWEHNDCVQWGKLKLIFDAYYPFVPEHDWLEPLIKDAVQIQKENSGWYMSPKERDIAECLGKAFGVSLDTEFRVTLTYTQEFDIRATDEELAIELAQEQFRDLAHIRDVSDEGDWEAEEI